MLSYTANYINDYMYWGTMIKTPMELVFGETPALKILTYMMSLRQNDYSTKELANGTGLCRQAVTKWLKPLLRFGLIKENRKVGRHRMYQFNDSETACAAEHFNSQIVDVIIMEQKALQRQDDLRDAFVKMKIKNGIENMR